MATAVSKINNQMFQPYSDEAAINPYTESMRRARRKGQGRTAMLTRGQRASGGVIDLSSDFATAEQINPRAVSKAAFAEAYAPADSFYQFAARNRGRFFKKNKSYAQFLGIKKGDETDYRVGVKRRKGDGWGKGSRRQRELNKITNKYKAYLKEYQAKRTADIDAM